MRELVCVCACEALMKSLVEEVPNLKVAAWAYE